MVANPQELEQRLAKIERQLAGDPAEEPIDLRSLPLRSLQNQLEILWRPEGRELLEPKSVTATEIGELPGGRMERVLNQAIPNGAWTKLNYGRVRYDMGGFRSPAGCVDLINDRLVIRTPGIYVVTVTQQLEALANLNRIALYVNHVPIATGVGWSVAGTEQADPGGYSNPTLSTATILDCSTGDYLEAHMFQTTAAPALATSDQYYGSEVPLNHFACAWIGTGRTT